MLDVKEIIKKYKDIKASSGGADYVKLQSGENRMRIVPFINEETGKEGLYAEAATHFLGKGSQVCLKQVGERCPVCQYIDILLEEDTKESKKIANEIRVKKRFYFNVIQDGELKILEVGAQACQAILKYVADPEYGIEVFDLKRGYDFKITKEGSGLDTEYDAILAKNPSTVKLPGKPKDLANRIRTKSVEELEDLVKAEFEGATFPPADDDAGDGDARPRKKNAKDSAPVDELDGMSRAELKDIIEEEDLDVRVKASMSDTDIAAAIREARGTGELEEEHKKAVDKDDDDDDRKKKKEPLFDDEDDLDDKDRSELKDIIEEEELEIVVKKADSDDDIREGIREMRKQKTKHKPTKDEENEDPDEDVTEMFSRKSKDKKKR